MAVSSNVPKPQFQDTTRSKVVRTALEEHDAAINDLQSQINSSTTPPVGSEVTNARDGFDVLRDRLRSGYKGLSNVVITGFTVAAQDTPDLTMQVGSGTAVINGVGINLGVDRAWSRVSTTVTITEASHTFSNTDIIHVEQSTDTNTIPITDYTVANVTTNTFDITGVDTGATSGTVTFGRDTGAVTAATNEQWAVPTISSDGTLSIILGSDIADAVLPVMAITNRPIAIILLTSSTTSIVDADIVDAKNQGVISNNNLATTKWYWKIQDAVDDFDTSIGGQLTINPGNYYEEVDITGNNNLHLLYIKGANHFKVDDSASCIKSVNTVANETVGNKISGGEFFGQGNQTASLFDFDFSDDFTIENVIADGDLTGGALNLDIDDCDGFRLINNDWLVSGIVRYDTTTALTNVTLQIEDGYFTGQVAFSNTLASGTRLIQSGWTFISAANNRVIRSGALPGNTGGSDTHNHKWYKSNSGAVNDQTYDSGGTVQDVADGTGSANGLEVFTNGQGFSTTDVFTTKDSSIPNFYEMGSFVHR